MDELERKNLWFIEIMQNEELKDHLLSYIGDNDSDDVK